MELETLGTAGAGFYLNQVDGRSIALVPGADFTTTIAYELDEGGAVRRIYETDGWSRKLFRMN